MKTNKSVIRALAVMLALIMIAGFAPRTDTQAYAEDTIEVYPMQDVRSHKLEKEDSINLLGIRGRNGNTVFISLRNGNRIKYKNIPYTLEGDEEEVNAVITEEVENLYPGDNYDLDLEISVYADRANNDLLYRGSIKAVLAELSGSNDSVLMGISTDDASVDAPELFYYDGMEYLFNSEMKQVGAFSLACVYYPRIDSAYPACPPSEAEDSAAMNADIPVVDINKIETLGNFSKKEMKIIFPSDPAVTNYQIRYRMAGGKEWHSKWSNGADSFILQNIKKSGLCEFRIAGYLKHEDGSWTRGKWSALSCRYMKAVKIKSAKAGRKSVTVSWQKDRNSSAYQISYSIHRNMSKAGTINIGNRNKTACRIKHLKKGKKYYISVCPVRIRGGRKYTGIPEYKKTGKVK